MTDFDIVFRRNGQREVLHDRIIAAAQLDHVWMVEHFLLIGPSPRGLYPSAGGGMMPGTHTNAQLDAILWLLMLCDGATALPEIARQANLSLPELHDMAAFLEGKGLLRKCAYPHVKKNNALALVVSLSRRSETKPSFVSKVCKPSAVQRK